MQEFPLPRDASPEELYRILRQIVAIREDDIARQLQNANFSVQSFNMESPDGTIWEVTIDNSGNLTTTSL